MNPYTDPTLIVVALVILVVLTALVVRLWERR